MISNDEFFRHMNEKFKEVHKRMDFLHQETKNDIDSMKKDLNSLKSDYNTHIAVGEALDSRKKSIKLTQKQKIGVFVGVVPILLAVYTLFFS